MDRQDPLAGEAGGRKPARAPLWRYGQLVLGLFGWGLAISLFVRSRLGLGPWDAFHFGLHLQTGISMGGASIATGAVILVGTTAAGLRPGIGTLLNMVLVGAFTDLLLLVVPESGGVATSALYFAGGLLLAGLASGMYIGAGLGHGPRDGLMVTLAMRTGLSVRLVRTLIEATVLAAGWAMGGTIGIGTLLIVLTIGPSVQWGLRLFGALPERDPAGSPGPRRGPLRRAA